MNNALCENYFLKKEARIPKKRNWDLKNTQLITHFYKLVQKV